MTSKSGLLGSGMHIGSYSPPRNAARKYSSYWRPRSHFGTSTCGGTALRGPSSWVMIEPRLGNCIAGLISWPVIAVMRRLRMIVAAGVHRAHQRELVHPLGDLRQQLRDLNAGDVGRDRLEVAVGLRDPRCRCGSDRLRARTGSRLFALAVRGRRGGSGSKRVPEGETEEAERTDGQEVAA